MLVAIIDRSIGALSTCLEKGKSFVEFGTENGDRESPWWLASDPHGTQMASIIHELDPLCKLYVAKVGTSRDEILNRDCIKRVRGQCSLPFSFSFFAPLVWVSILSIQQLTLNVYRQSSGLSKRKLISSH